MTPSLVLNLTFDKALDFAELHDEELRLLFHRAQYLCMLAEYEFNVAKIESMTERQVLCD